MVLQILAFFPNVLANIFFPESSVHFAQLLKLRETEWSVITPSYLELEPLDVNLTLSVPSDF